MHRSVIKKTMLTIWPLNMSNLLRINHLGSKICSIWITRVWHSSHRTSCLITVTTYTKTKISKFWAKADQSDSSLLCNTTWLFQWVRDCLCQPVSNPKAKNTTLSDKKYWIQYKSTRLSSLAISNKLIVSLICSWVPLIMVKWLKSSRKTLN